MKYSTTHTYTLSGKGAPNHDLVTLKKHCGAKGFYVVAELKSV